MARFSTDTINLKVISMSTALVLRGIGSASHNMGVATTGPDSGNPYDEAKFVGAQSVSVDFTTTALSSILGELSLLTGLCIDSDGTHEGLELFGQGHDPCGTSGRTAGSTNMQITVGDGHLVITGISGGRNADAVASIRGIALSNGTLAPTTAVYNGALPSSPIVDEAFIAGAPVVAGQALAADSVQSVSIDTGIELSEISAIDEIWATAVDITKIRPVIRIVTDDPSLMAVGTIKYSGVECTHANTNLWFIKRDPFGGLVSKITSSHIKVTAAGIAYFGTHYDASGSATGATEIVIETIETGGAVPLVVTTGVAVT